MLRAAVRNMPSGSYIEREGTWQWLDEAMTACAIHHGNEEYHMRSSTSEYKLCLCQFSHAVCVPLSYPGAHLLIEDGYMSFGSEHKVRA